MPKKSGRIDLPEAVKRADKARKRETGTPPKPYRPVREKKGTPSPSLPQVVGTVTQRKTRGETSANQPGRKSR